MGRGLSDLQRWILAEVTRLGYLYYADVCERYFGWTPQRPIYRYGQGPYAHDRRETAGQLVHPSSKYFLPAQVGPKEYRRGMVTLSRACRRLKARGLIPWRPGLVTTERVAATARALRDAERRTGHGEPSIG